MSSQTTRGSPGSRAGGFRTCTGSFDRAGLAGARAGGPASVAFRYLYSVGTLDR